MDTDFVLVSQKSPTNINRLCTDFVLVTKKSNQNPYTVLNQLHRQHPPQYQLTDLIKSPQNVFNFIRE